MPLLIRQNSNQLQKLIPQSSTRALYENYPSLKEGAGSLVSQMPKSVGPVGLLYVSQREFGVVLSHDKNISIVGTDDCTTCLAVVLRHPSSGAVSVGHFESVCVDGITLMIHRLLEVSQGYDSSLPLQLHIVGSFSDNRGYSEELVYSLMSHLDKESLVEVELMTACVGQQNTVVRGDVPWPILYGIGINTKSGEIFPATFPDKGPDIPLRHSRIFSGSSELLEIYDYNSGLLRIGPFHYEPLRCANLMLNESDDFILQHLTTSPEVEPSHVVEEIKSTLKFIDVHPFPAITVFLDNRPRYYRKDEESGLWALLNNNHHHQNQQGYNNQQQQQQQQQQIHNNFS